jgi:hypothetical protein
MAAYVEIRVDNFSNNMAQASAVRKKAHEMGVRRPLRGIEIKDDTYAVLKILTSSGTEVGLVSSSGEVWEMYDEPGTWYGSRDRVGWEDKSTSSSTGSAQRAANYTNFIIQNIQESREEKTQILETFGEPYIFFFGERPRILAVSGLLMNTRDFNWRTEFWYNYENYLRGTRLVERNAKAYLSWDDIVVEGFMLNATATDNSEMPYHIPFAFQFFVTNHTYLSNIGDPNFPTNRLVTNIQPLLQSKDVAGAVRLLKLKEQEVAKYQSNIAATRRALQLEAQKQQAETQKYATAKKVFSTIGASAKLLANALAMGLAGADPAQTGSHLTFLSSNEEFCFQKVWREQTCTLGKLSEPVS